MRIGCSAMAVAAPVWTLDLPDRRRCVWHGAGRSSVTFSRVPGDKTGSQPHLGCQVQIGPVQGGTTGGLGGGATSASSSAWGHKVWGDLSDTYGDLMVVSTVDIEPSEAEVSEPTGQTEQTAADVLAPDEVGAVAQATEPPPARDAASAAARLLEIAALNADQLLAEAQSEADQMKADARNESDQVLSEARSEAEKVRAELEVSRNQANEELARLRQTEQEHRDRMRNHLHEMLAKVDATALDD